LHANDPIALTNWLLGDERSKPVANAAAIAAAMNSLDALLECASVLADIAAQKTGAELDEDQYDHADFEGGYGILIDKARRSLVQLQELAK
jgi:hypothetical protein